VSEPCPTCGCAFRGQHPGATGRYPYGASRPDDEGELRAAMATDVANNLIRIEFGKKVAWLALPPAEARRWAAALMAKAAELDRTRS
jgi:hypothetical protein